MKKLTVRVVVQDCTGTVRFTDVMLQGGSVATAWVSHVSEQRYTFDAQDNYEPHSCLLLPSYLLE